MTPKIALEEHCMTPGLVDYWAPTMTDVPSTVRDMVLGRLNDYAGERIEIMDRSGVSRSILAIAGPGVQAEPDAALATRRARESNDQLAEHVTKNPERLGALAHLAVQDAKSAADELERCVKQLGFKGAMIGTQPKGVGGVLDDPSLDVFWKSADDLGSAIFFHPVFESGDNRVHDYGMANAIGRITDSMIALGRLIYAGHILKYKNVKFIAGIGGAGLPYISGRLRRNYGVEAGKVADPDASLAALWYDALVQDVGVLKFLASKVGTDRMMMGSDAPFPIGDLTLPQKIITEAGFKPDEVASINGGLAAKIFG
jgi:aminocarboxymuconate-semialdehyde decarboxylase